MDLNLNFFYLFVRRFEYSSCPEDVPSAKITFYKINGTKRGNIFVPAYSAVNSPAPYWWVPETLGGKYFLLFLRFLSLPHSLSSSLCLTLFALACIAICQTKQNDVKLKVLSRLQ